MSDNHFLLVPVSLQALAVNHNDRIATTWSLAHKNFAGLRDFEPFEPPPFARGGDWPRIGITLHWALPDALLRGRRQIDENGKAHLHFPLLPNRWLVLRQFLAAEVAPAADMTRAWLVASDYLGADGTSFYPTADGHGATRIGWATPLMGPDAPANPPLMPASEPHLTALGFGDLNFTTYIGNLDNVFSFYDSLLDEDQQAVDNATIHGRMQLSYTIVGWYAQPDTDPLADWVTASDWISLMTDLKWSLGDDLDLAQARRDAAADETQLTPDQLPRRTLYHGLVSQVNWTGYATGEAQTGMLGRQIRQDNQQRRTSSVPDAQHAPPARRPHMAIGNTTGDALAVMLDYLRATDRSEELATLLQALDHDLLSTYDEPGGAAILARELHLDWFSSRSGGYQWQLIAVDGQDSGEAPSLSPAQREVIQQLNNQENQLRRALKALELHRWELYALWWKRERRARLPDLPLAQDLPEAIDLEELIAAKMAQIDALAGNPERDGTITRLRNAVGTTDVVDALLERQIVDEDGTVSNLLLKRSAAPPFFVPQDPVFVIYGLKRSARYGGDGRFALDDSDTLFVRFSGQTFSGYEAGAKSVSQANLASTPWWTSLAAALEQFQAPIAVLDLVFEAMLLDAGQAVWLAEEAEETVASVLADQKIIWRNHRTEGVTIAAMTRAAGWRGVRPSPVAVEPWQPPWSPVYFSWQATWYPSNVDPANTMAEWTFNGQDYERTGWTPAGHDEAVTLQGRSLLTPLSTKSLEQNLNYLFREQYGEHLTAAQATQLEQLRLLLQSADLLAQSLTGFHERLMQRDRLQFHEPGDPAIASRLGDIVRAAPNPWPNLRGGSDFFPLRGGQFRIQRLWVVDTFGQVFDPIQERQLGAASFTPLRGPGLAANSAAPGVDAQMVQLPPRILQESRLAINFVTAFPTASASPVSGWLLPNHLDNALVIYDDKGDRLGSLLLIGTADSSRLRWQPADANQGPILSAEVLALALQAQGLNAHLAGFIQGIFTQEAPETAFTDLLAAIDATLWTTDVRGQRADHLSLLIGRPLALIRLSLELQLAHAPVTDQLWSKTGHQDSQNFTNNRFAVKIGNVAQRDDGVMGYFLDHYRTFWSVQPTLDLEQASYVQHGYVEGLVIDQPRQVTVLLDPRGAIHVSSGILPTQTVQLPRHDIENALKRMDVVFRIGPILSEAARIRMPLPTDIRGGWSWIAQTGVDLDGKILQAEADIRPISSYPLLHDTPLWLRDGWLKLSDALADFPDDASKGASP